MDANRYEDTQFGCPTRRPGDKWAFTYYMPKPLPRELPLETETVLVMSEADSALGHLQGLGRLIPDPELLVGPFLTREALASSRIEGTKASLSDVLKAEEVPTGENGDIDEVMRYLAAIRQGLHLIESLPMTQRLIKQIHATLIAGGRGEEKQPGELRSSPVWIGSGGDTPNTAEFVPPLPEHLPNLLTDWERFVNETSRVPPLVRYALAHYQFETIHPFLDGNGRIGRLIVVLMMIIEQRLTKPLLYLSGYLETHRSEYYTRLQAVRESGDIQSWIQFFCRAVRRQSDDAVARADALIALREQYLAKGSTDRSRLTTIIPLIFSNPFITVRRVQNAAHLTHQGARNLLAKAEENGWVTHVGAVGRGGRYYWVATEVYKIIDANTTYTDD